jgi:hypothetical protein
MFCLVDEGKAHKAPTLRGTQLPTFAADCSSSWLIRFEFSIRLPAKETRRPPNWNDSSKTVHSETRGAFDFPIHSRSEELGGAGCDSKPVRNGVRAQTANAAESHPFP